MEDSCVGRQPVAQPNASQNPLNLPCLSAGRLSVVRRRLSCLWWHYCLFKVYFKETMEASCIWGQQPSFLSLLQFSFFSSEGDVFSLEVLNCIKGEQAELKNSQTLFFRGKSGKTVQGRAAAWNLQKIQLTTPHVSLPTPYTHSLEAAYRYQFLWSCRI